MGTIEEGQRALKRIQGRIQEGERRIQEAKEAGDRREAERLLADLCFWALEAERLWEQLGIFAFNVKPVCNTNETLKRV